MRRASVLGYILAHLREWEVGREGRQRRRKRMIRVERVCVRARVKGSEGGGIRQRKRGRDSRG